MLIHTGENRHECSTCGKRFRKRGDLNVHLTIHTGEKPFFRKDCKAFSQRWNRIKHGLVHSGDKPYVRMMRGKGYSTSNSLKAHYSFHLHHQKPHV